MLREIAPELWVAEQPFKYFGLNVGTRMTVIRLKNRELAVISPIKVDQAIASQLDQLGTVNHIIAPNLYHYLFASDIKTRYPNATFWATSGLELKQPNLPIDRLINDDAGNILHGLEYVLFDGFKTLDLSGFNALNEYVFFHNASRTLILTDTAFHFDASFPALTQFAAILLGGYESLRPSLLERVATTEKQKVSKSVQKILNWDFERVIMAHGSIVKTNGKHRFKQGYEQFLGQSL